MSDIALVTGNFDGLHLGHQALFKALKIEAERRSLRPVIVTFEPHTRHGMLGPQSLSLLTPTLEKVRLFAQLGLEHQILPFDREMQGLSARDFMSQILVDRLHTKLWLVGFDHRFGANASGDLRLAQKWAVDLDIEIASELAVLSHDGESISSTRIRHALNQGHLELANRLLGRPYSLFAQVEKGDQIGQTIGFPTANLFLPEYKLLPPPGVYAGYVPWKGERFKAVAHWGSRPTLARNEHRFEVHLLDFSEDLYDQNLEFRFAHFVRGVQKFDGLGQLQAAIARDIQYARQILDDNSIH